jgi:colicin import membrane protein
MDESKGTPKAVILSAILHVGIVAFLFLATLPCSSFENFISALGLPASMNPITCTPPLNLQGQVIDAVLLGPTGSPPPKTVKTKVPDTVPPPPTTPPPPPTPPKPDEPKIKTLPPPPEHPDTVDQEKVVEDALQKADNAKKLQEEKEQQRQSELDAQAVKKKQEQQKKVDDLLRQLDAAADTTKKLDSKAKQAKQQMEDLASDQSKADLPKADQLQSGNNSDHTDLSSAYAAAIQNAVTPNWLRPDNIAAAPCDVDIVQSPGGDVISATAAANCPYDDAGKRSVENAVLRTKTLPYKGFESVFRRTLTFTFRPQ